MNDSSSSNAPSAPLPDAPPPPRRTRLSTGEIATLVIFLGLTGYLVRGAVVGIDRINDFNVFHQGAVWAWENQPFLFTMSDRQDRHFLYPPTGAYLLMPLAWCPYAVSGHLFTAGRVAALVALFAVLLCWMRSEGWIDLRREAWVLALLAMIVLGRYLISEFRNGQINVHLLAASVAGVWLSMSERRPRSFVGGMLIALAGLVKGTPFLFAGVPLLHRRWSALAGVATLSVLVLLGARVWFGPENSTIHWREFRDRSQKMAANRAHKGRVITVPELLVSASADLRDPIGADTVETWVFWHAVVLGGLFLGVRWARHRAGRPASALWDTMACSVGVVLVSPVARGAHLTLIMPAVLGVVAMLRTARPGLQRTLWWGVGAVVGALVMAGESLEIDKLLPFVGFNITLLVALLSLALLLALAPVPNTGDATTAEARAGESAAA